MLASVSIGTYVLDFFGLSVPGRAGRGRHRRLCGGLGTAALGRRGRNADPVLAAERRADREPRVLSADAADHRRAGHDSVAITIGANHPRNVHSLLINGTADAIGAALIALTVFVCYRYADVVLRRLGETGTSVLVRLSAFILFCIGVQIFWNGASALLADLPCRRQVSAIRPSRAPELADWREVARFAII